MGLELAGKTFGGYRVGDVLDSGPQGVLYAAEHSGSGDKVALKVYAADLARDKSLATRVVADVQRAVAVTHPNLAVVREVATAEFKGKRHLFVAMERLPGESLKSLLSKQKGQPLALPRALHLGSEIAAALEAIHRNNQIHRQLHPGAVFVASSDGESNEDRVVILDLGAAAVPTGDDKKAKPGGKVQDDLRALAQLLYGMLGGGDSGSDISQAVLPLRLQNPAVPARVDAVLRSVLCDVLGSGDKAPRYDSAAAFYAALLGSGETQPSFVSWSEDGKTLPPPRKSGGTLIWAGIVAVAGGLALGYFLFPSDTQPGGSGTPVNPTRPPVVDRAGGSPRPAFTSDAGVDAATAVRAPGPGSWPLRPGGVIPQVRAADEWPTATAAAASGSTGTPATPAAKPTAPTANPTGPAPSVPGPSNVTAPTPPAATVAPPAAAMGSVTPSATTAKPPAAPGGAMPGPGVAPSPSKPAAAPLSGPPAGPAAKPVAPAGSTGVTPSGAPSVPAAKPAAPAANPAASTATPASKAPAVAAPPATPAPAAKPGPMVGASPTPAGSAVPAAGNKPAAPVPPQGVSATSAKVPGPVPVPTPASARPATAPAAAMGVSPAKPAAGPGSPTPAAGNTAVPSRSPSAPAAPAGAVPAAKNPEPRPSTPGASAPAAKPAASPGGAN